MAMLAIATFVCCNLYLDFVTRKRYKTLFFKGSGPSCSRAKKEQDAGRPIDGVGSFHTLPPYCNYLSIHAEKYGTATATVDLPIFTQM